MEKIQSLKESIISLKIFDKRIQNSVSYIYIYIYREREREREREQPYQVRNVGNFCIKIIKKKSKKWKISSTNKSQKWNKGWKIINFQVKK